jgi:putative membrane protein
MLFFFLRLLLTAIVVIVSSYFIPELRIKDLSDCIIFGLIVGLVNAIVRPILVFITLPINFFTLGLFTLVVNIFTYWLASEISYGVHILTFWGAFWGGLVVWITGLLTNRFLWSKDF